MKFGIYEEEDLLQEAYLSVSRVIHKFDAKKGKLFSFLYTHIHNRMKNLRRDKLERLTPPCAKCPLNAYCEVSGCQAYDEVMDCSYYRKWKYRNAAKKSLAHSKDIKDDMHGERSSPSFFLENHEEIAHILNLLSDDLAAQVNNYLSGASRLSQRQFRILIEEVQTEIWGAPIGDLNDDNV